MGLFFVYILKSSVCLAIFYLFYRLLLARETFHRFNRFSLLGILLLSCLLPLVEVSVKQETEVHQTMLTLEQLLMMADAVNATEAGARAETATVTWIQVALLVYLAGIVFFAFRNVYSLVRLLMLLKSGKKEDIGSYLPGRKERVTLIVHNCDIAPFSWMGYIVISRKDLEENGREILIHELAHIHNRHSWDLLVADVCIFFQWFNPASWLLKQELQNIHEFEADEMVIKEGVDAKLYQLLLIKKAVGTRLYSMANSFNHSSLKKRITMMLKKKSNNWARLKLALLVPVGFAALSAFARPETSPPPAATMTDNIHLSINKSTVNQETMQQDHAVFLTYKESGSEDLNSIVCKTLDRIRTRVAEGQFKNALEVTVNPAFDDIPASYLETVKDVLEERDIKCKIDMTVPNTIMDDVAKPYRKYDDVVYLIQNKKIVAALSISKFSANQNDPRLDKISKSASLILQPENPKVSRQEMEKLKNLLDKKGLTSEINMNIFKIGDAAAPPPPPPAGQVIFSYRDGQPDQQFVLYDRHAKPGANLGQRIDKIYKDNITKVSIKINKSTPKDLLETVKQELKKKINYPVQYEILQFVD